MPRPPSGYFLKEGTRVPSVTTINGRFGDKGQLMFWAFNQGKEGKATLYEESGKAADVGTLAHQMVEARIKGEKTIKAKDIGPELIEKARQAFAMYEVWARQAKVKIIATELDLVSEEYRYGGTPDAIGETETGLAILDWKTSNGVYVDHLIQVAAYGRLWEENHPESKLTGGYHLLRFSKDYPDFAHRHYSELNDAWEQFKHFRASYELDKLLKKRVG